MNRLAFAQLKLKTKHMRRLVSAMTKAGLEVSLTSRGHVRVKNPKTNQVVVISSGNTGDYRTILEMYKDLKKVGFDAKKEGLPNG